MAARQNADPAKTRDAVHAVEGWLRDDTQPSPGRAELAAAVGSPHARWPPKRRRQRRGPDSAVCRGAMHFRAQAYPRHAAQCRRDRSAHLAAAGHRTAQGGRRRLLRGTSTIWIAGRRGRGLAAGGEAERLGQRRKSRTHQIDTRSNDFAQVAGTAVVTPFLDGHHKSRCESGARDLGDEVEVRNVRRSGS